MRVLLDTQALLYWLEGDRRLGRRARMVIEKDSNVVYVSAASAWEISTKARLGKLPGATAVAADLVGCVAGQGFTPLDITLEHGERAGALGGEHRDPFDRMLAAQAQAENLPVVTNDPVFEEYGVRTIW